MVRVNDTLLLVARADEEEGAGGGLLEGGEIFAPMLADKNSTASSPRVSRAALSTTLVTSSSFITGR